LFTNQQKKKLGENFDVWHKNKKATNITNGFSEELAQSNHIFKKI